MAECQNCKHLIFENDTEWSKCGLNKDIKYKFTNLVCPNYKFRNQVPKVRDINIFFKILLILFLIVVVLFILPYVYYKEIKDFYKQILSRS